MNSKISIKPFTNPSGATVFRVSGFVKGKRKRENYQTNEEAVTVKQNWERENLNMEPLPAITTRLTSKQAAEAEAVFLRLDGSKLTLTEAVDFALKNYTPAEKIETATKAYENFLADKKKANKRTSTLRNIKSRVGRFIKSLPEKINANEISTEQVTAFIFRPGSGTTNQGNDYRALSGFFNYCVDKTHRKTSPLASVENIESDPKEPKAFSVDEAQALVNAAASYKQGRLLPYVVLGLFCGIRPNGELYRITWAHVNLQEKFVRIGADAAKTRGRSRRIVEISDNAIALLTPHALKRMPIVGRNWRRDFDAIKQIAGWGTPTEKLPNLKPWVKDIMRHTAITFHLRLHQNEGKTAEWAGNSPDVIHKDYKALVPSKTDVEKFWKIGVETEKIIQLPATEKLKMATI